MRSRRGPLPLWFTREILVGRDTRTSRSYEEVWSKRIETLFYNSPGRFEYSREGPGHPVDSYGEGKGREWGGRDRNPVCVDLILFFICHSGDT